MCKINVNLKGEELEAVSTLIRESKKLNKKQEVKKVDVPIALGMS